MKKSERLNKVLAQLGYGSRRSSDLLIASGRVRVNDLPAHLGQHVTTEETITIDGKAVTRSTPTTILLAFNKPRGVTTTKKDKFAKVTVMDFLPQKYQALYPIGRLDKDSRGLLLFTNNGDIALKLEHPRYAHEKEYVAEVIPNHPTTQKSFKTDLQRLATSIIAAHAQSTIPKIVHSEYDESRKRGTVRLILKEGKKRQIRELFKALGYYVHDLERIRIQNITLDGLKEGAYAEIDPKNLSYD